MNDAVLSFDNRFHATPDKAIAFTDQGASFDGAQPLTNLGKQQLSTFAAFTGEDAELDCEANDGAESPSPVAFSCDVLGLMGLQEWEAGTLVEFLDDTEVISAASWRPVDEFQRHLVTILPQAVSLDTLTVRISNAGTGTKRIGAVWAGPSLRFALDARWPMNGFDTGIVTRPPSGTAWTYRGKVGRILPVQFRARNVDLSYGLHLAQGNVALPDPFTTDNSTSESGGVYTFTGVGGTLLAEAGALTGGTHYEAIVEVTYGAGNAGVPALELGTGNQFALGPGVHTVVGTPDDGSDTALRLVAATAGNFTGTVEIKSLKTAQAPKEINADRVLRVAASTGPVLWMPRTSGAWLNRLVTYGLIEPGPSITHVTGPVHDVAFGFRESI